MKKLNPKLIFFIVAVFLMGFVLMFPFQNIRGYVFDKIYANTGILLVADDIYPLLLGWPGIGIKNVNVTLPVGESEIELSSDKLSLRARLGSFFPPVPAVSLYLKGLKKGGELFLKVGQKSQRAMFNMEAERVNLEQITIPGLGNGMPGILDSDIRIDANTADLAKTTGSFVILGESLKTPNYLVNNPMLGPPFQIPGLEVGSLDIHGHIKNGVVEIQAFKFGNPTSDLSGSLVGDIKLGRIYPETHINVTLSLKISPKIINNLEYKTFLDFLNPYKKDVPGEFGLRWNASIQEIMGLMKALPEPVK